MYQHPWSARRADGKSVETVTALIPTYIVLVNVVVVWLLIAPWPGIPASTGRRNCQAGQWPGFSTRILAHRPPTYDYATASASRIVLGYRASRGIKK